MVVERRLAGEGGEGGRSPSSLGALASPVGREREVVERGSPHSARVARRAFLLVRERWEGECGGRWFLLGVVAGGGLEEGVGGEPSPGSRCSPTSPAGAGEVGGGERRRVGGGVYTGGLGVGCEAGWGCDGRSWIEGVRCRFPR